MKITNPFGKGCNDEVEISLEIRSSDALELARSHPKGVKVDKTQTQKGTGRRVVGLKPPDPYVLVVFTAAVHVPATVLANWIWEKLKNRKPKQARVNGREIVKWENGEIVRYVEVERKRVDRGGCGLGS